MQSRTIQAGGTKLSVLCLLAVILGLMLILSSPGCHRLGPRHALAGALNNVRQVKFALDGFASDFDGHYPSIATGEQVIKGGTGTSSSNDFFRQLIVAGETQSEAIFWVKGSPVAAKSSPDDEVSENGQPVKDLILKPGDCHWAYMTGQTTKSTGGRPLVLDPFLPGKDEFSADLWDRKTIVVTVDGSARALRMRISDNKVLDGSNTDILSSEADAWHGSGKNPRDLLVQPAPAPGKR